MLSLAAAINFCSIACFIGSAPAIIEKHWGMSETSYCRAVPAGHHRHHARRRRSPAASPGAWISRARCTWACRSRSSRPRCACSCTSALDAVPIPLQQALLFVVGDRRAVRIPGADAAHAGPVPGGARHRRIGAIVRGAADHRIHARHRVTEGAAAPGVDRVDVAGAHSLASLCWHLARRWHEVHAHAARRRSRLSGDSRARMLPPVDRRRHHPDPRAAPRAVVAGARPVMRRSSRVACAWSAKPLSAATSARCSHRRIERAQRGLQPHHARELLGREAHAAARNRDLEATHAHAGGAGQWRRCAPCRRSLRSASPPFRSCASSS